MAKPAVQIDIGACVDAFDFLDDLDRHLLETDIKRVFLFPSLFLGQPFTVRTDDLARGSEGIDNILSTMGRPHTWS